MNKTTASVKAAILLVYDKIGGDAAFAKWARTNRDDYYNRIYTKLVPVDITSGENPIGQPQYFDVAKLPADTLLELITAMDRIKKLQPEKVNAE